MKYFSSPFICQWQRHSIVRLSKRSMLILFVVAGLVACDVGSINNSAPTASSVTIIDDNGGSALVGDSLTGSFIFADIDNDTEGASTYRWLRSGAIIGGATTITYTLIATDDNQTIVFEVTPVATTGILVGAAITSSGLGIGNSAPVVSNVSIASNSAFVGDTLTGSYTYSDIDSDNEGETTFRWLRNGTAISGATNASYILVAADSGETITIEITPVATVGVLTGVPVTASGLIVTNSAPTASSVSIMDNNGGGVLVGDSLTGNYTFADIDDDIQGESTYRWLRNDVVIDDVTAINYTLVAADNNQTIVFEVTPVAATGTLTGSPEASSGVSVVLEAPILSLTVGIKQLQFSWPAVVGTTHYMLMENSDGISGFTQLGANITGISVDVDIAVYRQDWANARYFLQACNASGCSSNSGEVGTMGAMLLAIGYVKASNTGVDDEFGRSMALSGDGNTLAVGAFGEGSNASGVNGGASAEADNSASDAGAVYVFSRSDGNWFQQAYLKASNTEASDWFGFYVALSSDGNTLVVGARNEDSNATGINGGVSAEADNSESNAGAVYVFSRSGGRWSQQAYIKASNAGFEDEFGSSLALSSDGNTLAVGAEEEDSNGSAEADDSAIDAGAVYVFSRSGSNWSQQAYVKASNIGPSDEFGSSLALSSDGNTLAVGARNEGSNAVGINGGANAEADNSASGAGAAYVFSRSGGSWSQQAYVKASNTESSDGFGFSLDLSSDGKTLVVGARNEDSDAIGINGGASAEADNSASGAGAVYVFNRNGNNWSQQAYVKASNTGESDVFGFPVVLSNNGNILAVGAFGEDSNATGINGGDAAEADNSASRAGAVYVFSRGGGNWSQQSYVKASNTEAKDWFGLDSVALSGDGNILAVGAWKEGSNAIGVSNGTDVAGADNSAPISGAVYLY